MDVTMQIFKNKEFGDIRATTINNKPYFVGKDIAEKLGYIRPRKAIQDHCKGVLKQSILTDGGKQEMSVIPEGDIYRLIIKSQLPEAEKFEEWVMEDVLPSIRKNGGYILTNENDDEETIMAKAYIIAKNTIEKNNNIIKQQNEEINKKDKEINELLPKANYVDLILQNKGLVNTTQIAQDYGMSARKFNDLLHKHKIQYKLAHQWILYEPYKNKGYVGSKTTEYEFNNKRGKGTGIAMSTKWTQAGRKFLYDFLKEKEGLVPTMERGSLIEMNNLMIK